MEGVYASSEDGKLVRPSFYMKVEMDEINIE